MIARLTALILTLCVGLPMCWCCTGAGQPQDPRMSCCARKEHAASKEKPQSSQDHHCPCAKHEIKRDIASTVVQTPAAVFKVLAEQRLHEVVVKTALFPHYGKILPLPDHGPPWNTAPVYARHCALLI